MNNHEEDKIRKAFASKDWNDIKASDSWSIFKIMSEFVEGFEKMSRIGPCVSLFGSARTKSDNPYYKLAEEIAFKLTKEGYGVMVTVATTEKEDVLEEVKRIAGNKFDTDKIDYFLNELHAGENKEVPDPWYGNEDGYVKVYDLIDKTCNAIIEKYLAKNSTN